MFRYNMEKKKHDNKVNINQNIHLHTFRAFQWRRWEIYFDKMKYQSLV